MNIKALVFGVIRSINFSSIFSVSKSISTNTGTAFISSIGYTEVANVKAGAIISSPGCILF